MLTLNEVNSNGQFAELEHDWSLVLENCGESNPYLTWDWVSTYWKHFGEGKTLRTLTINDHRGETVAIAPLRQTRYNFFGLFSYNVIEPLAFGFPHSMYSGIMLPKWQNLKIQDECLKLFLCHLHQSKNWDFIYLFDLQETSILPGLLRQRKCTSEFNYEFERGSLCYYTVLPSSPDLLMKSLSARFRHHLRGFERRLEKTYGKVEFKTFHEWGSVEKTFKVLVELTQKSRPENIWDKKLHGFFLELSKKLAEHNRLALNFLIVNNKPVASLYCIEHEHKIHYLFGGFDPEYSQYSTGNLLMQKAMENYIQKGILEFSFGKGKNYDLSKYRYPMSMRRTWDIRFKNRTASASLYNFGIRTAKQTRIDPRELNRFLYAQ